MAHISGTITEETKIIVLDSNNNRIGYSKLSPVDNYTKLLLHFDESPIVDSSKNPAGRTLTLYGGVDRSATQSKFGGYSVYFDNVNDYISVSDSDDWDFGTSNFTIDCWIMPLSVSVPRTITGSASISVYLGSGLYGWVFGISGSTGGLAFGYQNNNSWPLWFTSPTALSTTSWSHVAIVRNGNTFSMFVNGTVQATTSYTGVVNAQNSLYVGRSSTVHDWFSGYIEELRISKEAARWTSNFTPDTSPYTIDIYTKLLLHGNESPLIDSAGKCITNHNNVGVSSTKSKFGGYSGYFQSGNSTYVSVPDSEDWNFGSGDFTIDTWVNFSSIPSSGYGMIVTQYQDTYNFMYFSIFNTGSAYQLYYALKVDGAYPLTLNPSINITSSAWYHVAVVRSSNTINLFFDGSSVGTTTYSGSMPNYNGSLRVGYLDTGNTPGYYNGYMDEVRVSKGIARWTSNFTPPTSPYAEFISGNIYTVGNLSTLSGTVIGVSAAGEIDGYHSVNYISDIDSNVKLLMHFDDAGLSDSSVYDKITTLEGGVARSATQSKFGGYSAYFDGSGDYVRVDDSADWDFGSGNFTIDSWIRLSSLPPTSEHRFIVSQFQDSNNFIYASVFNRSGSTELSFNIRSGGTYIVGIYNTAAISINTWYHIAIVRNGNYIYTYLNGAAVGVPTYFSSSSPNFNGTLRIGYLDSGYVSGYWHGYIDEFRISKGVAQWTSNFTPPTVAYI